MNLSEMHNTRRRPLLGENNNALVFLIILNALFFVSLTFIKIVYFLSYDSNATAGLFFQKQIVNWLALPADTEVFFPRIWTILTYMFTTYSVWGIISTVLWIWAFGYILQDLAGNKNIMPIYLYGGFFGGIAFVLSVNLIPALYQNIAFTPALMGGGAAVMAIAVATTTLAPDYRIFPLINGGIPIWVLTLIFVAIDYATIASQNGGNAIAHLTGGIVGFLYIRQLKRGSDWGNWMHRTVEWVDDLFNPEKKNKTATTKEKLFYQSNTKPFQKTPNITQQRLDDILDKINQQGYHMLSEEEKEFLKKASKDL
ncbi:MAG: rhomboid family intramembrane serine protease [Sphingobacteriales bacterium]|uniref:rhomboid family intramembrane serine protease n=1 Tax=Hydrotalea flava TaxID=714549 RepID=UPI0008359510|nr:rhomboid family intramembrane serine protease [Hydrotalea flava]RTL52392.1 MAG: rhomboid family intramembrane serine protease [Sphingobacteriales bacterium]